MNRRVDSKNAMQSGLLWLLLFIGYLVFVAYFPTIKEAISFHVLVIIQLIVCGFLFSHWYSRINFSKNYTGSKADVYAQIDKIQFAHTGFLNLGFKTRGAFVLGIFENSRVSKIIGERYDILILFFSLVGEFMVYLAANDHHFNVRRGFLAIFWRDSEYAKNIISGLGGYVFLWGFSLFILGLVSKHIDLKGKK